MSEKGHGEFYINPSLILLSGSQGPPPENFQALFSEIENVIIIHVNSNVFVFSIFIDLKIVLMYCLFLFQVFNENWVLSYFL